MRTKLKGNRTNIDKKKKKDSGVKNHKLKRKRNINTKSSKAQNNFFLEH